MARSLPPRRSRNALVAAMIGDPGNGLPDPRTVDLDGFWRRFDEAAPLHLVIGFNAADVAISRVLPRLMGHIGGLAELEPEAADRVIQRAAGIPGVSAFCEIAKIVACFAYFSDPQVDAVVRGRR